LTVASIAGEAQRGRKKGQFEVAPPLESSVKRHQRKGVRFDPNV
jgi:hypothetical protein